MTGKLKLRAEDADDIAVIAACLQDALVAVGDIAYLADERRFVLVANRFRWEDCADGAARAPFSRVHCGICFEGITRVQQRKIDRKKPGDTLELLTIRTGEGCIDLVFAGGAEIRLNASVIACRIEDMDEPWPTSFRPSHADQG
jgi:hypothetical protein